MNTIDPGQEISDLIVDYDTTSLERRAVKKSDVLARLSNRGALRVVEAIPEKDGFLDNTEVDCVLLRSHYEMQRISELFEHGGRVASVLVPIVNVIRQEQAQSGALHRIRIVDIGCGTGFVIRWLAAKKVFPSDVELVGVDYNRAFVAEATRLATLENLSCSFIPGNAFDFAVPADVFISTGVLHHFRNESLQRFFANQDQSSVLAVVHFDFQQSPFGPLGSWLFHEILMREPLARHDGVLSARRAHSPETLLSACRKGMPGFTSALYNTRLWLVPLPRVMHAVLAVRPELKAQLITALGGRAHCALGEFG